MCQSLPQIAGGCRGYLPRSTRRRSAKRASPSRGQARSPARIQLFQRAQRADLRYHRQQSALRWHARARRLTARVRSRTAHGARRRSQRPRCRSQHFEWGGSAPRAPRHSGRRSRQQRGRAQARVPQGALHLAGIRAGRRRRIFIECRAMSGNTIGKLFTVTTCGESHGPALACIVDGCPPGLALSEEDLQRDVDRRRTGTSHFVSQRREGDHVRIFSGLFEGKTTGTPIGLLIENTDARSRDYEKIKDRFRPGHADYTYQQKYGFRDYRGGGRSSARETVMRVAAGAIARKYLAERLGVRIHGFLSQIGAMRLDPIAPETAYDNPFFCPDPARIQELESLIWKLREEGDSIGARVTVVATGVPPGLGEPVFDKLDAEIAYALMGINAVKAVE